MLFGTEQLRVRLFELALLSAISLCFIWVVGCDDASQSDKTMADANKFATQTSRVKRAVYSFLSSNTNAESHAWQDFLAHWPDARQYAGLVWDDSLKRFRTDITATAILEERYVLKIIFDFEVSEDSQEVVLRILRFHFLEVKEVRLPPEGPREGGTMTTFQPDQKWFSLKEWQQLVNADWDFSKIGITIVSNAPIPNIRNVPHF